MPRRTRVLILSFLLAMPLFAQNIVTIPTGGASLTRPDKIRWQFDQTNNPPCTQVSKEQCLLRFEIMEGTSRPAQYANGLQENLVMIVLEDAGKLNYGKLFQYEAPFPKLSVSYKKRVQLFLCPVLKDSRVLNGERRACRALHFVERTVPPPEVFKTR